MHIFFVNMFYDENNSFLKIMLFRYLYEKASDTN